MYDDTIQLLDSYVIFKQVYTEKGEKDIETSNIDSKNLMYQKTLLLILAH